MEKHSPTAKHFFQLQTLQCENSSLRKQATTNVYQVQTGSEYPDTSNHSSLKRRPSARGSRPMSMYETGSGQKPYLPVGESNHPEESRTRLQPFPAHVSNTAGLSALHSIQSWLFSPSFESASLLLCFAKLGSESCPCVCCINVSTDACNVPTAHGHIGDSGPYLTPTLLLDPFSYCISQPAPIRNFCVKLPSFPSSTKKQIIKVTRSFFFKVDMVCPFTN